MFVGIDVSKSFLDICLLVGHVKSIYRVKNQAKAIGSFFTKIQKQNKGSALLVCMENTGYYNWPCYDGISNINLKLYCVNPLHLKKSMGLTRGKNDVIDASRIATFLSTHISNLNPSIIPSKEIRLIQALLAQRQRFVDIKAKLKVSCGELIFVADKSTSEMVKKSSLQVIKQVEIQIKKTENQIQDVIKTHTELGEQYSYMTSVQGVGKVLAWTLLIKTNGFKSINNARKLACYAGVVPFEYQSGNSIYKKPRVSFMADKTLKKLLHLAAMRVIQLKGDLQNYYQRKVSEGKNKMLILNAVRNKILARICSVVNNKRFYENNLLLS